MSIKFLGIKTIMQGLLWPIRYILYTILPFYYAQLIIVTVDSVWICSWVLFYKQFIKLQRRLGYAEQPKLPEILQRRELEIDRLIATNNNYPFVLVHGVFGWGEGSKSMPSYWSGAELLDRQIIVPSIGKGSSHHDRACELFYQLVGGRVDYGEVHSMKSNHLRFGRTFQGYYKQWSEKNPLHFIGHSMGADTIRTLQHLLEDKFFIGYDTSDKWIKSISCISPILNGITSVNYLGLKKDGLSVYPLSPLHFLQIFYFAFQKYGIFNKLGIDFMQEQYQFEKMTLKEIFTASPWVAGDWCVPSMTLDHALSFNKRKPSKNIYYFSYQLCSSNKSPVYGSPNYWPQTHMNFLLMIISASVGRWNLDYLPYEGFKQEDWYDNDGIVQGYSQNYPKIPFEHPNQPMELVDKQNYLQKGVWYYSPPIKFCHISVSVFPGSSKLMHQSLYLQIYHRIKHSSLQKSQKKLTKNKQKKILTIRDWQDKMSPRLELIDTISSNK